MSYIRYVYTKTRWKNKSESLTTPLGKTNLNHMEDGIYNVAENLDIAYNEFSAEKFDKKDADKVIVGMPKWDSDTGILTFRFYDGTEFSVDFNIEKIPVSFSMDSSGVITMITEDGTEWTADIGDVIPTYSYEDSDTIAFSDTKDGDYGHKVSAQIKKNSITGEYLQPNYLADVTTQASNAASSAKTAKDYADDSANDAKLAQSFAIGETGIREGESKDNAKYYKEQAESASAAAFFGKKALKYDGWYRVAKINATTAIMCIVRITKSYNYAYTENYRIGLSAAYALCNFYPLVSKTNGASQQVKKIRLVTNADGWSYIEVYFNGSGREENLSVWIESNFSNSVKWESADFESDNEIPNVGTVSAEMEMPLNFDSTYLARKDGSNVEGTWENLVSGQAKRLTTDAGSDINPVYFKDGMPVECKASQGVTVDSELSSTSENPVQNKVLYDRISNIDNTADADKSVASAAKLTTARVIDGVSFNGSTAISHYGTCSTAAGTAAKTVSLSNFTLVTGAVVRIKFTYTNTASTPTLNVNNTGAKTIRYNGSSLTSDTAGYLAANRVYEFLYDGSYWRIVDDPAVNYINNNLSALASRTLPVISRRITGTSAVVNIGELDNTDRDGMYLVAARCHVAVNAGFRLWIATTINGSIDWPTALLLVDQGYGGKPLLDPAGSHNWKFDFYNADGGDISIIRLNP